MVETPIQEWLNEDMVRQFKQNHGMSAEEVKCKLEANIRAKQNGQTCESCGNPIWAAGSTIVGWFACFPCITGESDDSQDFEVIL